MQGGKSSINDSDLDAMIAKIQSDPGTASTAPVSGGSVFQTAPQPPINTPTTQQATTSVGAPLNTAGLPNAPQPDPQAIATEPVAAMTAAPATSLDAVKADALQDLRPLVDKLDLAPDDKFDTLLLLIRSSDDSSLIPEAYETARQISDDARRAQALLDIIREVDFFDHNQQ